MGMAFYLPLYCLFAFLTVVAAWDVLTNCKLPQAFVSILMAVPLILLATFRAAGVGSDDLAYVQMIHDVPSVLECVNVYCDYSYSMFNVEFGFFMFLSTLAVVGREPWVLFGASSLVAVVLNVRSIRYFSPYFALSVLVYFTHFYLAKELNAIRLGIASGLLFMAAMYLHKKRYTLLTLYVALATLVHVSSVLFLIPIVLYLVRPKRITYFTVSVVLILMASFVDLKLLLRQLTLFGFMDEKIKLYLDADIYNYALPLFDLVNIKNLLLVIAGLVWSKKLEARYPTFNLVFCFFYCATFLRIVLGDFAILAGRGYASISVFEYVLLPMIAIHLFGKKTGFIVVIAYTFTTLYLNLNGNSGWTGSSEVFFDFF